MALDRAQLGVGFAWHTHAWEDLLELVQRSESIGFGSAWIDGDVSMLGRRTETEVLDGWTTTIALLASTRNIAVGSMRLVHHWNAARLAQLDLAFQGRLKTVVSNPLALAEQVGQQSPTSVTLCKQLVHTGRDTVIAAGLAQERDLFVELFSTEDQREGVNAFLEKRKPEWKNC